MRKRERCVGVDGISEQVFTQRVLEITAALFYVERELCDEDDVYKVQRNPSVYSSSR